MSLTDDVISATIEREGPASNDPLDHGGRTAFGISEAANPQAWADGQVTEEEARLIYERKYVKGPHFDQVQDDRLRAQLVDFGVNSGPMIAIIKLQEIVGTDVDGLLGPATLGAILDPLKVNNLLVVKRVKMIAKIVSKDLSQVKYLNGWINRALEFLVP